MSAVDGSAMEFHSVSVYLSLSPPYVTHIEEICNANAGFCLNKLVMIYLKKNLEKKNIVPVFFLLVQHKC